MNFRRIARTVVQMGPKAVARRAFHLVRTKSGWIERLDPHGAFARPQLARHLINRGTVSGMLARRKSDLVPFFFDSSFTRDLAPMMEELIPLDQREALIQQANAANEGRVRFFSHWDADLGDPIDWHLNPLAQKRWPADNHWSKCTHLDPELGDTKLIWEPSRFAQAYLLTRAFALTNEKHYLELCLRRIEGWIDANPPVYGVHWNCGQETSFRLMAWCFALQAMYATDVLDQERFAKILASIYRQAQRVERHIGFARSLENNHAISEAVGLYTVGRLFPEFDRAKRWLKMGKRIICKEVLKQVFVDGSYIQHSMNYHRVMLDDCLWAVRLGDIYDDPFPQVVTERLGKAVKFLLDMQDAPSGRVPNYGSNDGALVLPLSSCDYLDYRPILQAWSHQLNKERCFDAGAWDETSLWMLGPSSLREACHKSATTSARYDTGGYYTLRGDQSWAMMRCHTYRKRPAEADMLHLDLWWKGENILRDGGSYSYNCKPPFDTYFKSTAAHNTLVVEESNQMTKGPRFMWFDWTRAKLNEYSPATAGAPGRIEGEHSAYQKRFGVTHRRRVDYLSHDNWLVSDRLLGAQSTNASSMWHFPDVPHKWDSHARQLDFDVNAGRVRMHFEVTNGEIESSEVLRAHEDENSAAGWESLYYGAKQARPVLRINLRFGPDTALVTRIEFKLRS